MIEKLRKYFELNDYCILIEKLNELKIKLNDFYTLYIKESKGVIYFKVSTNNSYTAFDHADFNYYSQVTTIENSVMTSLNYIINSYKYLEMSISLRDSTI